MGNGLCKYGHHAITTGFEVLASKITAVTCCMNFVHSCHTNMCIAHGFMNYTVHNKLLHSIPACFLFHFVSNTTIIRHFTCYINNTPMFIAAGYTFSGDEHGHMTLKAHRHDVILP
jgi:hypothetical protein